MTNVPFDDYARNQAWLTVTLIASNLIAWTQLVCLNGELARAEPETLRHRLFYVAARLSHTHCRHVFRSMPPGPGDTTSPPHPQQLCAHTKNTLTGPPTHTSTNNRG